VRQLAAALFERACSRRGRYTAARPASRPGQSGSKLQELQNASGGVGLPELSHSLFSLALPCSRWEIQASSGLEIFLQAFAGKGKL